MEHPLRPHEQVRLDADGRISEEDFGCLQCDRSLRGVSPDGVCPKCGTPVGRTAYGPLLRDCDPGWGGRLALGADFLIPAILSAVLLGCLADVAVAAVIAGVFGLIACWLLTTAESGSAVTGASSRARRITRAAGVIAFVPAVYGLFLDAETPEALDFAFICLVTIVPLVLFFAACTYARHLALRAPDRRLAGWTRWFMWLLAVCYVLVTGLPLVCAVLVVDDAAAEPAPDHVQSVFLMGTIAVVVGLVIALLALLLILRYLRVFSEAAGRAPLDAEQRTGLDSTGPNPSK